MLGGGKGGPYCIVLTLIDIGGSSQSEGSIGARLSSVRIGTIVTGIRAVIRRTGFPLGTLAGTK
jgi:hypothetical protein